MFPQSVVVWVFGTSLLHVQIAWKMRSKKKAMCVFISLLFLFFVCYVPKVKFAWTQVQWKSDKDYTVIIAPSGPLQCTLSMMKCSTEAHDYSIRKLLWDVGPHNLNFIWKPTLNQFNLLKYSFKILSSFTWCQFHSDECLLKKKGGRSNFSFAFCVESSASVPLWDFTYSKVFSWILILLAWQKFFKLDRSSSWFLYNAL